MPGPVPSNDFPPLAWLAYSQFGERVSLAGSYNGMRACRGVIRRGDLTYSIEYVALRGYSLGLTRIRKGLCTWLCRLYSMYPRSLTIVPCVREFRYVARSTVETRSSLQPKFCHFYSGVMAKSLRERWTLNNLTAFPHHRRSFFSDQLVVHRTLPSPRHLPLLTAPPPIRLYVSRRVARRVATLMRVTRNIPSASC